MLNPRCWVAGLYLFCQSIAAQPVVFVPKYTLLNPASGFVDYVDCAVDMNGDDLDDVVRIGHKSIYIDYQQPDASFSQRLFPMQVQSLPRWSICAGDVDNDGYNDLLLADSGTVSLLKARKNGGFYQENVMPVFVFSQRSTLADINNDGWLDAFVCHDTDQSVPFRNDGKGNLTLDTNLIHTADRPGSYAAIWTDYDNDGDSDLYITKCEGGAPPGDPDRTNLLYRNNGDGSYSEAGAQAGVDDNAQSWSTVFEDFDNDGDFDAFVVNHDFQNRLFRNNGDGTFTNRIANSGINAYDLGAWENASGDFNNDGFVDIFSELKQELYLGKGDLIFTGQDVPVRPGAIADLNNDGFLDVMYSGLIWLNQGNSNHWLKIVPLGVASNRAGIGARIEVYGAWGRQIREVRSGQSFSPMSSLSVHFGLGQATGVDSLKIRWPSGIVTTLRHLAADSTYRVPEAPCVLPATVVGIQGDTNICPGDTTWLHAPDGFESCRWSDHGNGVVLPVREAGRYYAFCSDSAGCIALSQTVEIKTVENRKPLVFSPEGNVVCQGDTLTLYATAGAHHSWSNGVTDTDSIRVSESGVYTVAVDASCGEEPLVSAPFEVVTLSAPLPVVSDTLAGQGDSILLRATGEHCEWYDLPAAGNLLATGPFFQTQALDSTATYFVESHHRYPGQIQQGGKTDTTATGGLPAQGGHLLFEVWEPFILRSVRVYRPPTSLFGVSWVQLFSGNSLIASKMFSLPAGWNTLDLDFDVPVGQFTLRCPQHNLWSDTETVNYPYPLGTVGRIDSSLFGKNDYFYFYDWKIQTRDFECVSERVAIQVAVSGAAEQPGRKDWAMSPNPSAGLFRLERDAPAASGAFCSVRDVNGREVFRRDLGGERSFLIDLRALPAGLYCVSVFETGTRQTSKLLLKT